MRRRDAAESHDRGRPSGIGALSASFAFAAAVNAAYASSLAHPATMLGALRSVAPGAWSSLHHMGAPGVALTSFVAVASLLSAVGLWIGAVWGRTLALVLLVEAGLAATADVVVNGDPRGIIAQPLVAPWIAYLLLSVRVERFFGGQRATCCSTSSASASCADSGSWRPDRS